MLGRIKNDSRDKSLSRKVKGVYLEVRTASARTPDFLCNIFNWEKVDHRSGRKM